MATTILEMLLAKDGPPDELKMLGEVTAVINNLLGSMPRTQLWKACPLKGGRDERGRYLNTPTSQQNPLHSLYLDEPMVVGEEMFFPETSRASSTESLPGYELLKIEGIWVSGYPGRRPPDEWLKPSVRRPSKWDFRKLTWGITKYGYVIAYIEGFEVSEGMARLGDEIAQRILIRKVSPEELLEIVGFRSVIEGLHDQVRIWAEHRAKLAREAQDLELELGVVQYWFIQHHFA